VVAREFAHGLSRNPGLVVTGIDGEGAVRFV
jgi:hypothetical protein